MQIKGRKFLSNKDKKLLQIKLSETYGESIIDFIQNIENLEEARADGNKILLKENRMWFFSYNDLLIPSIYCLRESSMKLPKVIVDVGAIRFITNGADVMAPGVVFFDETIHKDAIVAIHEERAETIIAVGMSLIDAQEFEKTKKGKVVKMLHYLKDNIWNFQL
ncbi:MAG: PUA domain-containing protein [Candidatus Heimdallarchaeaceae archaeon]|jgi:PUA domain protein